MDYFRSVSISHPMSDSDQWVETAQNLLCQTMHPLFENVAYFHSLPLQLQWRESLITVGCSSGQTGHEWAIGCCRSWCFCVARTPCNLMFPLLITVLYDPVVNRCQLNVCCISTVTVCLTYSPHVIC